MNQEKEKDVLKEKMDEFVHLVYGFTKSFPKEELYGVTSQLRRACLSIILNYIEGYARLQPKVFRNFLEISYGSFKETKYLLFFSLKEEYLSQEDYGISMKLADEIGALLWTRLSNTRLKG